MEGFASHQVPLRIFMMFKIFLAAVCTELMYGWKFSLWSMRMPKNLAVSLLVMLC